MSFLFSNQLENRLYRFTVIQVFAPFWANTCITSSIKCKIASASSKLALRWICFYFPNLKNVFLHVHISQVTPFKLILIYLDIYSIKLLFLHVIAQLIIEVFAFIFINITLLTKNLLRSTWWKFPISLSMNLHSTNGINAFLCFGYDLNLLV